MGRAVRLWRGKEGKGSQRAQRATESTEIGGFCRGGWAAVAACLTAISPDGECCVVVTQRSFGAYSAQRLWRSTTPGAEEWEPLSVYLGIYDSPETAEVEAFARPRWKPSDCDA